MWGYSSIFDRHFLNQVARLNAQLDAQVNEPFGDAEQATNIRSRPTGSYPAINVGVTPEAADVYVFAAGMSADQFDVSLQQNQLSIAGKREIAHAEGSTAYRRERFDGEFRRVVSLPDDIDADAVSASYVDGVLHVRLGRRGAVEPRRIQIH